MTGAKGNGKRTERDEEEGKRGDEGGNERRRGEERESA